MKYAKKTSRNFNNIEFFVLKNKIFATYGLFAELNLKEKKKNLYNIN
jgi:hypothetical protein